MQDFLVQNIMDMNHENSNFNETEKLARKIVTRAIESFVDRKGMPVSIPKYETTAEVGFSVEYVNKRFGGLNPLVDALKKWTNIGYS